MRLKCSCGSQRFGARIDALQQVGLLTCERDHSSLLLDSRDVWFDVIQDGRPREVTCKCRKKTFFVRLEYELRGESVRSISVYSTCIACDTEREVVTFDIDYEPTDQLVERPLDPCPDPWSKAQSVR